MNLRSGAQIDEDEVACGKRVAVPLVGVDAPHPDPQESSGLFAQHWPWRYVAPYEVEKVVRHLTSVPPTSQSSACASDGVERRLGQHLGHVS
jgi:hypothetical protein